MRYYTAAHTKPGQLKMLHYFMINLTTETSPKEANYEVHAQTSGFAVALLISKLGAGINELLLHNIHIGAPYDSPISDEEMKSWPEEDWFERV